jgi:uncharacterized membrane protein YgdD (TMEM256/DUF423 family)
MFNNVGTLDRLIRLVFAAVLLYLGLVVYAGTALGIGLAVASAIPAMTAVLGSCMLYGLLGINTRAPEKQ